MAWFVRVVRAMAACAQRPRFALDPEGSRELFSISASVHALARASTAAGESAGVCGGVGGDATGETCFVTSAVVLRLFVIRALDSDISRRHWAIRTICSQLIVGM